MKISTLILSVCGFCIFYICNADWIDDLIEEYLGSDYEEVAPFISSVAAGAEEFDQLVEELSQSRRRWRVLSPGGVLGGVCAAAFVGLVWVQRWRGWKGRGVVRTGLELLTSVGKSGGEREEVQRAVAEFVERKLRQLCGGEEGGEEVPVKLLWKGGSLVESSVHCSIRKESRAQQVQRQLGQPPVGCESGDGGGDETRVVPSGSESSTARKMAEIRKLLESEQELSRFVDKGAGTDDRLSQPKGPPARSELPEDLYGRERQPDAGADRGRQQDPDPQQDADWNASPDPKLMNRIRLLESRLRLEELKNRNWISRMSRAEGILQQLNKQVERIEEARPVGTLTETLKITSTVTNWAPAPPPRRNAHFTVVNQYPPFSPRPPYTSLSELIKREVGLPSTSGCSAPLQQLPPPPAVPALHGPPTVPPSSFLSRFLSR